MLICFAYDSFIFCFIYFYMHCATVVDISECVVLGGVPNLADIYFVLIFSTSAGSSQFIHITAVWTASTWPTGTC
jgi:hypothetical protein